jgi:predicted transposase/invertase (TIGR01784 family)
MTPLEYTFKNDTLFKMLFVKYPELLKKLIAALLNISFDSIEDFRITNPEMPPEALGDKFCRLDIIMEIDGQRVDLEIQVHDEKDYPERSLFYWAREYSAALDEGKYYAQLPQTVVISIVAFKLFDCGEFHSEFRALEVTRHEPLTDRMALHYFELTKLPEEVGAGSGPELWLALFRAETEEELEKIKATEVPEMEQAIGAYRNITATSEFREKERLRSLARHNEAAALHNAEQRGAEAERGKWLSVIADKDAAIADKDAAIADKDAAIADKDAAIAELRARLGEKEMKS